MKFVVTYKDQSRVVELVRDEVVLGRPGDTTRPDLDLTPDTTVSRRHARLYVRDGKWWVEDLESKFGTFVNGVKLEYRRMLRPEDIVGVGESSIRLQVDEDELPTVHNLEVDELPTVKTLSGVQPPPRP